MEKYLHYLLVVLCASQLCLSSANPEADAQADALPDPEADPQAVAEPVPEADPQMMQNYMPSSYMGYNPYMGRPMYDNCAMSQECCNFENQGCCMNNEEKCYIKYEQQCDYQNEPSCKQEMMSKCFPYEVKSCRTKTDIRTVQIPKLTCRDRTEQRCFNYTRNSCDFSESDMEEPVSWVEQRLENLPNQMEKCVDINSCRIEEVDQPITTQKERLVCSNYTINRPVCSTVPVAQPPRKMTRTVFTTEQRTVCYDVPRVKCTPTTCNVGCPDQSTQTCSQNTMTQQICPISGLPDNCGDPTNCNTCQQMSVPQCGVSNSCQQPQQCCRTEYEKQYRTISIQVPKTVVVEVPSPPTYEKRCQNIPDTRTSCRKVMEPVTTTVKRRVCRNEKTQHCTKIDVPETKVVDVPSNDVYKYKIRRCRKMSTPEQFCQNVVVDVDCTESQETRRYNLKYPVCDQTFRKTVCARIPYSVCQNNGRQVCKTVPRKVCQPSCTQSDSCNRCNSFFNSGQYQPCNTGQCNSYYTGDNGYMDIQPLSGQMSQG